MSDLFMDMHHKRLNGRAAAATGLNSDQSSTSSASTGTRRKTGEAPLPSWTIHNIAEHLEATPANGNDDNDTAAANEEDEFDNVLSLKLKKPKHWKWELTTSRSFSNIALPRILLYDHKGELLVDANSQNEQTYKPQPQHHHQQPEPLPTRRKRSSKAATANLAQSIRKALDREFNGLKIQEATPSPIRTITPAHSRRTTSPFVDFNTNELPDCKFERRSNSLKGVRFKVDDAISSGIEVATVTNSADSSSIALYINDLLPTPPPSTVTTPTTTLTTNSSSSGPREKRRYRRSYSSGRSPNSSGGNGLSGASSSSILERFSFNKGRFSSPEMEFSSEQQVHHAPRYFLRTSKAGTLVVQEESFSRYRRRRRCKPKNSSSENIQDDCVSRVGSLKVLPDAMSSQRHLAVPKIAMASERQCGSLQNVAELYEGKRKKEFPVRRYRSDGNVMLEKQLSTSEEELEAVGKLKKKQEVGYMVPQQQQRKYANFRRHTKRDVITVAPPGNGILHSSAGPTAR